MDQGIEQQASADLRIGSSPRANSTILLVAYHYPPAIAAGSERARRFAKYLPDFGYATHVVADRPAGSHDSVDVSYVEPGESDSGRFGVLTAKIVQLLLSAYHDRYPWVPAAIVAAERVMRRTQVDIVISTSPPAATHLVALWLKLRHGLKWIADFRDPLADSPQRKALRNRISDRILQGLIFRYADATIAVTDVMARIWLERSCKAAVKSTVVWNGFDPEEHFPGPQLGERPYKVLAHVGDCYGDRHPGQLLESLDRLIASGLLSASGVRVQLTGPLDSDSPVRTTPSFAALQALGCLQFNAEAVPRRTALQAIVDADYLLVLDLHDIKNGYALPSKLFDYVRAGRPILAFTTRNSTVATFLAQCEVPYACVYPDDNEEDTDQKVLTFLSRPAIPVQAGEWFWKNFDGRRQAGAVAALLEQLRNQR